MSSLILYLLEASGILAILYLLYWLLLRKETFFSFNRFFLLAIPAFSFLFPLLSFELSTSADSVISQPIGELRNIRMSYHDVFEAWTYEAAYTPAATINNASAKATASTHSLLFNIAFIIYITGLAVVVFQLMLSYCWVLRLKSKGRKAIIHGITVVKVARQIAPFSFLNAVFVHKDMVRSEDFEQILAHEKTHIKERHSLDLLFVQLSAAVLWFNPVVWQLIKSLKTNHEYIADKKTIDQGYSLVTYQSLLLRQLISNNSYGLIHNFNLSFIKKRITMMNVKKSGWAGKAKVALALSAAIVFSLVITQCNTNMDEQGLLNAPISTSLEVNKGIDVPVLQETEYPFKLNPDIARIDLSISGDKIIINGEEVEVGEIASILKDETEEHLTVIVRIDGTQSMDLVSDVHKEFRKANILKFLYIGQTPAGAQLEVPILLPPSPSSGVIMPEIDEQYAREHNMDLLKIRMGEDNSPAVQDKVYDFVKEQVGKQNANYVVSARFSNDDTFDDYLSSVFYMKEAFFEIYTERAEKIYGKDYKKEDYSEVHAAVKKGIPMAISIAED